MSKQERAARTQSAMPTKPKSSYPAFASQRPTPIMEPSIQARMARDFTRIPLHSPVQRAIDTVQRAEEFDDEEPISAKLDPAIQRVTGVVGDQEEDALPISKKSDGFTPSMPDVPVATGGGSALPSEVQAKMEGAFGHDFSSVRVHQGPEAASIGALAYTRGTNLHFQPGQYNPHSNSGQELLGHELTHVVQQSQGRVAAPQLKGAPINADPGLEAEADKMGKIAANS